MLTPERELRRMIERVRRSFLLWEASSVTAAPLIETFLAGFTLAGGRKRPPSVNFTKINVSNAKGWVGWPFQRCCTAPGVRDFHPETVY
jgi:hypothetical protein